jgi:hypothetical protein
MLAVQLFEHHLAHVWLWHHGKLDAQMTERNARRLLRQANQESHRASASELRRGLEDVLAEPLLEEIGHAIACRNYLAHQFLRERLRSQPMPHFVGGSGDVLDEMRALFADLATRLETLMDLYATSVAEEVEDVPEELKLAWTRIGWRLWRGDYPDDPPRPHPPVA